MTTGWSSRLAARVTSREKVTYRMRFSRDTKWSFRRVTKSNVSDRPLQALAA
jgi:hypothetical protein